MITAAAIKHEGIIFTGVRHSEILSDLIKLNRENPTRGDQGFIDHKGEFLSREEAKYHAFDCNQISETDSLTITSDDLW